MKYPKVLFKSILIVIIVTVIFFAISTLFTNLDQNYFQEHLNELTTTETINMSDGVVTNYFYADTPYSKLAHFFFWLYLIVPVLVVIILCCRDVIKEEKYLIRLLLPLSFIILTFILQAKNIYDAVGWEKDFGIMLISLYGITTFILVSIINLILLKFRKSKHKN